MLNGMPDPVQPLLIKLSPLGQRGVFQPHIEARHPWPAETFLQAGKRGIVFTQSEEQPVYRTAFVEAFVDIGQAPGFYRGEAETVEAAETAAYLKFQKALACDEHEWFAGKYTNGGGHCRKCGKFGSNVFTGEQLGQFCHMCGVGTTGHAIKHDDGIRRWYCSEHQQAAWQTRHSYLMLKENTSEWNDDIRREVSLLKVYLELDDDDD